VNVKPAALHITKRDRIYSPRIRRGTELKLSQLLRARAHNRLRVLRTFARPADR
jgi:hypothetical protein